MRLPTDAPAPTAAPSLALLELRQNEGGLHVITQVIIRHSTTITTLITLGNGDPTPSPSPSPTPTPTPSPVPASSSDDHKSLTSAQVGAILGSVIGFVVILLIVGYCVVSSRRMPITEVDNKSSRSSNRTTYQYVEEDIYYAARESRRKSSASTTPLRRPPAVVVTEKIPGGPKFPTYRAIPISNPRNPQIRRV